MVWYIIGIWYGGIWYVTSSVYMVWYIVGIWYGGVWYGTSRAGNEPSYSGSARKKLGSGLARELNEPSLSLNLGLINLGLGSGSLEKSLTRTAGTHPSLERGFRLRSPTGSGLHRCDPDSGVPE